MWLGLLLEHMYKKFEINQTKIKGGCQSGRKGVHTHDSKSNLPLVQVQWIVITMWNNFYYDVLKPHNRSFTILSTYILTYPYLLFIVYLVCKIFGRSDNPSLATLLKKACQTGGKRRYNPNSQRCRNPFLKYCIFTSKSNSEQFETKLNPNYEVSF